MLIAAMGAWVVGSTLTMWWLKRQVDGLRTAMIALSSGAVDVDGCQAIAAAEAGDACGKLLRVEARKIAEVASRTAVAQRGLDHQGLILGHLSHLAAETACRVDKLAGIDSETSFHLPDDLPLVFPVCVEEGRNNPGAKWLNPGF